MTESNEELYKRLMEEERRYLMRARKVCMNTDHIWTSPLWGANICTRCKKWRGNALSQD